MAKMYMEKAHREGYEGPIAPFHRSDGRYGLLEEDSRQKLSDRDAQSVD
jgi:hypothetical protein